jgi:hypothetical protein
LKNFNTISYNDNSKRNKWFISDYYFYINGFFL